MFVRRQVPLMLVLLFLLSISALSLQAQMGTSTPLSQAEKAKAAAEMMDTGALENYPRLVDITAQTGIHFNHLSAPEARFIVESMSGGVALIDYDKDGWPDIYFTNAASVELARQGIKPRSALFHNNHDGTFSDVTDKAGVAHPGWAMGAVVGDYDNDGWPDLLVTCLQGVVLYRNNHDGTFSDMTQASGLSHDKGWAMGAAFGDYDKDGWPDLFVDHYVAFDLDNLPVAGSAKACNYLGQEVQCGPRGLPGSPHSLYHNDGAGHFVDVARQAGVDNAEHRFGLTALWSDFNQDGNLDLLVTNDGRSNYLYQGNGKGQFEDVALLAGVAANEDGLEQANMGLVIGDYLHEGRMGIAISHFDSEYAELYHNDGAMNFTDVSIPSGIARGTQGYVGWGDAFVDFANRGWLDLLIANGHVYPQVDNAHAAARYMQPTLLFLNRGNGSFQNVSRRVGEALLKPQVSRGLAIGDLFNDGHLEAVIENLVGEPMILRPEGGPAHHWISFELEGTHCNRLALNARMRVVAGDLVQSAEVLSGGSYLSQNDLRLHFGLAQHDRLAHADVFWPDGRRESYDDLQADCFYHLREGDAALPLKPVFCPALPTVVKASAAR